MSERLRPTLLPSNITKRGILKSQPEWFLLCRSDFKSMAVH